MISNEEMNGITNLWIAVLHAGIEDALYGWNDAIAWLDSQDFKEICSYNAIDPEFAISLYKKRWIPVQTRNRPEISFIERKTQPKISLICKVCNKEMLVDKGERNKKKTCSYVCAQQLTSRFNSAKVHIKGKKRSKNEKCYKNDN